MELGEWAKPPSVVGALAVAIIRLSSNRVSPLFFPLFSPVECGRVFIRFLKRQQILNCSVCVLGTENGACVIVQSRRRWAGNLSCSVPSYESLLQIFMSVEKMCHSAAIFAPFLLWFSTQCRACQEAEYIVREPSEGEAFFERNLRRHPRMAKKLQALPEVDVNRLTAAIVVPRLSNVFVELLQNSEKSYNSDIN